MYSLIYFLLFIVSAKTGLNVNESIERLITEVVKKNIKVNTLDISFDVPISDDDIDDDKDNNENIYDNCSEINHDHLTSGNPGTLFWNSYKKPTWSASEALKSPNLPFLDKTDSPVLKLVIIGHEQTGKTNYISKFISGSFNPNYKYTIGVDFKTFNRTFEGKEYKLQIWDTAGQEKFSSLTTTYLKKTIGFIIMYNITDPKSFDIAREKYMTLSKENPCAVIMLLGNKTDLEEDRVISTSDGEALARELNASLFFEGI